MDAKSYYLGWEEKATRMKLINACWMLIIVSSVERAGAKMERKESERVGDGEWRKCATFYCARTDYSTSNLQCAFFFTDFSFFLIFFFKMISANVCYCGIVWIFR